MRKELSVNAEYLSIPVCLGGVERKLEVFLADDGEKLFEFMVPVADGRNTDLQISGRAEESRISDESFFGAAEYHIDYNAYIPVSSWNGMTIYIEGDVPEAFLQAVDCVSQPEYVRQTESRPLIHFTADHGWTNDPNGLIFDGQQYHLYFQYYPFNVVWNNLCWGHAVSTDLLHWAQMDTVMYPDEDGLIFSGCAVRARAGETVWLYEMTESGEDGTARPEDEIIYFFTDAGGIADWSKAKPYVQKMAYSTDGGETLAKIKDPCVPKIYEDSRDPKVFWHEESGAWIMLLWLRGNDFGILRSTDLKDWELTQELTLEDGWECPDLFELSSDDGRKQWFFWAAEGYYYVGDFDGRTFTTDGWKHEAYITELPYAAQTYFGTESRTVSIPWLRMPNDDRKFTSSYGIPTELSWKETTEGPRMVFKPVRELLEQAIPAESLQIKDGIIVKDPDSRPSAVLITVHMAANETEQGSVDSNMPGEAADMDTFKDAVDSKRACLSWKLNGSQIRYIPAEGLLSVDGETYHIEKGLTDALFLVDDRFLEMFLRGGTQYGSFVLQDKDFSLEVLRESSLLREMKENY